MESVLCGACDADCVTRSQDTWRCRDTQRKKRNEKELKQRQRSDPKVIIWQGLNRQSASMHVYSSQRRITAALSSPRNESFTKTVSIFVVYFCTISPVRRPFAASRHHHRRVSTVSIYRLVLFIASLETGQTRCWTTFKDPLSRALYNNVSFFFCFLAHLDRLGRRSETARTQWSCSR